jgi:hypothetical protein
VQFLQDDELGALSCELADFPGQSVAVVADVCRVVLLYDTDFDDSGVHSYLFMMQK